MEIMARWGIYNRPKQTITYSMRNLTRKQQKLFSRETGYLAEEQCCLASLSSFCQQLQHKSVP